jgi:predicted GNAT superfamily acetyltransferase
MKVENARRDPVPPSTFDDRQPDKPSCEKRIEEISASNIGGLLELNNLHAQETSSLNDNQFRHLLREACYSRTVAPSQALILAFDPQAGYYSPNFLWFCERFSNFVYIDRVIVSQGSRRQGLAGALYQDLFNWVASRHYDLVVCEVNAVPPNPASDSFHEEMGFIQVGNGKPHAGKRVRYLSRSI